MKFHLHLSLPLIVLPILSNSFSFFSFTSSRYFIVNSSTCNNDNASCFFGPVKKNLSLFQSSSNENDIDVDIDWLVMSLSRESDDVIRREKLATLFAERGIEEGFADAFEKSLENVGTKVQQIAREKAAGREVEEKEKNDGESDDNELPPGVSIDEDGSVTLPERTSEELQLWALVDMMVQSKVIMKKMKN